MTRERPRPGLTEAQWESLRARLQGQTMVEFQIQSGMAKLHIFEWARNVRVSSSGDAPFKPPGFGGLIWQLMSELQLGAGMDSATDIMFDDEFAALGRTEPKDVEVQLAERLGPQGWEQIKADALSHHGMTEDHADWPLLLIALGAEHLSEPLSVEWLAAMALHAHYIAQDDFAAGYLMALMDQRLTNEEHFERGAKSVVSAALGGKARAAAYQIQGALILSEMARFVELGHSASRAAKLAHGAGHGTSPEANRRLWVRHKR